MELTGKYKANYTLDRVLTELVVKVELKVLDGLRKPGEGVYYGVASVNGLPYEEPDVRWCVNAQYCAESIGRKLLNEYKLKAKDEGKSFRVKKK